MRNELLCLKLSFRLLHARQSQAHDALRRPRCSAPWIWSFTTASSPSCKVSQHSGYVLPARRVLVAVLAANMQQLPCIQTRPALACIHNRTRIHLITAALCYGTTFGVRCPLLQRMTSNSCLRHTDVEYHCRFVYRYVYGRCCPFLRPGVVRSKYDPASFVPP